MGKLWILLWYWIHPLFHLSFVVSPKKKKKKSIMYLIHSKNIPSNHFGSIQFIWSNQNHFDPIFCSILVHVGPFSPLWSFTLFGPFRSTSVPQVYFSPFGPFSPLWSLLLFYMYVFASCMRVTQLLSIHSGIFEHIMS